MLIVLNNRKLWNAGFILMLFFSLISCEEEFQPVLDKYDDQLVVDGLLTNGENPVLVKLSVSSPVYDKKYIPLPNAEVHLTDQDQTIIFLSESEPGTYVAADNSFRGKAGTAYQLHITLPNGKKYLSDECLLKQSIPIDSVYGIAQNPELGDIEYEYPGLQFYVENHTQTTDTAYFLWRLEQTYKYRSTFEIDYFWAGEYFPYPKPDSLHTCWITTNVGQIIFASTRYLDPTAVNSFPLHYVSSGTKKLSIRYSLLVKQLNISKEAFNFFNILEQQNLDQGDLWSKQLVEIRGNMHSESNSEEPVLGYFLVAGATEKRIFVDRPEITFYYTECTPDYDLRWVPFEPSSNWPIYIDDIMFLGWAAAERDACFDCRLDGGEITPPDFWED